MPCRLTSRVTYAILSVRVTRERHEGAYHRGYDLFSAFMNLNKLNIVVPGTLKYNCPGFIANVKLGDKSVFKKQQLSGDITTSGNYLILGTESRFIKGHFHQMLELGRFDNPSAK